MKKSIIVLISSVFVLAIIFVGYQYFNNGKDKGQLTPDVTSSHYLTISINPEVELELNADNEVTDVISINEDADVLTSDLNLVGLNVEDASTAVIDAATDMGYIDEYSDENAVMISVYSDDETERVSLQQKVIDKLNSHFETRKVYAVLVAKGLNDELKQEADNNNISYGKMLLVEEALALNPDLNKEDLVKLQVADIQSEIKSYVTARHEALKITLVQARETWKQEKAEAKATYQTRVQELKDQIWNENKAAYKNLTAVERAQKIKELLEQRKQQLKQNMDEIKEEIKETTDQYNYPIIENNLDALKERIQNRKNR